MKQIFFCFSFHLARSLLSCILLPPPLTVLFYYCRALKVVCFLLCAQIPWLLLSSNEQITTTTNLPALEWPQRRLNEIVTRRPNFWLLNAGREQPFFVLCLKSWSQSAFICYSLGCKLNYVLWQFFFLLDGPMCLRKSSSVAGPEVSDHHHWPPIRSMVLKTDGSCCP